jgi:hypothetical protein
MQESRPAAASERNNIHLSETADLLVAVPHLIGLYPVNSVVVIGLHGIGAQGIGLTIRADIPDARDYDLLAEQMLPAFSQQDTTNAIVVVIGGSRDPERGALPHRGLVDTLDTEFTDAGIPIVRALWVPAIEAGADWRCYGDPRSGGVLGDPRATELAMEVVLAGAVTAASRDDVVARLAPIDRAVIERRVRLLESARRNRPVADDDTAQGPVQFAMLRDAIDNAAENQALPVLADDDVVTLVDALNNTLVRDACLIQPDEDHYHAAERLMTVLVRTTVGRDRADAASLVALYAYRRGDGVLAGIALDNAEDADPGHRLTSLLRAALHSGLPPKRLVAAFESASRQAADRLAH